VIRKWEEAERDGTLRSNAWLFPDYKLDPCPKCGGEPRNLDAGWATAIQCSECDFVGPIHDPYTCCHWAWNNLEN